MRFVGLVLVFGLLVMAPAGLAVVPQTMSYQGVLQDQNGQPLADGDYELTFRIYKVASGGTPQWSETQTVSVADGVFHAILGDVSPLSLPFDVPYWLGIRLESNPEFTPRVQLASAPYALRAQVAEVGEDADWTIAGSDIYRLNGKIGIGTSAPQQKLDVSGTVRMTGFQLSSSPTAGYVLTSDATGAGSWQPPGDLTLPFAATTNAAQPGIWVENEGTGAGLHGVGYSGSGLVGNSLSADGVYGTGVPGVRGLNISSGHSGSLGSPTSGVQGIHSATQNQGLLGTSTTGVYGEVTGALHRAVYGHNSNTLSWGYIGGEDAGIYGAGLGSRPGVYGKHSNGNYAFLGTEDCAVYASNSDGTVSAKLVPSSYTAGSFKGSVYVDGYATVTNRTDLRFTRIQDDTNWPTYGESMELAYSDQINRGYIQVYDRDASTWGQLWLGDGKVGIGVTSFSYKLDVGGDIGCYALHESSDARLKENVLPLENALERLLRVRGVTFTWNEEAAAVGAPVGEEQIGVLAQEVERVFPELVSSPQGCYKAVDYSKLTAVLVEAIRELRDENQSLQARVEDLEASRGLK